MTPLTGMSATDTNATNYCMRLTGYTDTARVYGGERTSTAPAGSVTAGTFTYYNSSTNSYSSLAATSTALDSLAFSCSKTETIGGATVQWVVSVSAGGITHAQVPATTNEVDASDSQTRLEVEATVQPIRITFDYELRVNGVKEIDLVAVVDPGTLLASGVYGPPPEAT
jgi:hypothetical protein